MHVHALDQFHPDGLFVPPLPVSALVLLAFSLFPEQHYVDDKSFKTIHTIALTIFFSFIRFLILIAKLQANTKFTRFILILPRATFYLESVP